MASKCHQTALRNSNIMFPPFEHNNIPDDVGPRHHDDGATSSHKYSVPFQTPLSRRHFLLEKQDMGLNHRQLRSGPPPPPTRLGSTRQLKIQPKPSLPARFASPQISIAMDRLLCRIRDGIPCPMRNTARLHIMCGRWKGGENDGRNLVV